jgi:hypothetical protein
MLKLDLISRFAFLADDLFRRVTSTRPTYARFR